MQLSNGGKWDWKFTKSLGNLTLECIAIVCVVNVLANEGEALIRNGMCVGAHF
jgi:hypothetical protein